VIDNARTLQQFSVEPAVAQPDFTCDYYKTIQTPTLVNHGENTNPWWQYESESMAGCMPNAELQVLATANHDGPLSQPQQLVDYMDAFIKKTH